VPQDRNAELVNNLTQDFARRNEFNQSGARLSDVMMWLNRDGGGALMWAHDGQSPAFYGRAASAAATATWAANGGILIGNYSATVNGGPYITLDGIGEYLSIADANWQETTTYSFLLWAWFYTDTLDVTQAIAAKWTGAGNLRSWFLRVSGTTNTLRWSTNPAGGGGANVDMDATHVITASTFHFAAAYFQPSTLMRTFSGSANDGSLTIDSLTTGVPASVFNGAPGPPLTLGAASGASFLSGRLGIGLVRANVPATNINSHVTRLFQATRWFYQE